MLECCASAKFLILVIPMDMKWNFTIIKGYIPRFGSKNESETRRRETHFPVAFRALPPVLLVRSVEICFTLMYSWNPYFGIPAIILS